jgi:hypothetical protein
VRGGGGVDKSVRLVRKCVGTDSLGDSIVSRLRISATGGVL